MAPTYYIILCDILNDIILQTYSNLIHSTKIFDRFVVSPGRFTFAAAALVGLSFLRSPRRDQKRWKTWKCIVGGRWVFFWGSWLPDRFTSVYSLLIWVLGVWVENGFASSQKTMDAELYSGNGRSWMWVSAFDAWYLRGNEMTWSFGHDFNGSWDAKTTIVDVALRCWYVQCLRAHHLWLWKGRVRGWMVPNPRGQSHHHLHLPVARWIWKLAVSYVLAKPLEP